MASKRVIVLGRVQGVFYRASAKTRADDLSVKGWVRNEPDGSVMLEIEGKDDKVQEMISWCKEGPTYARVDDAIVEDTEERKYDQFEIRY